MLKVYLAGPIGECAAVCRFADEVNAIPGLMVVSDWHYEKVRTGDLFDPGDQATRAQVLDRNLVQMAVADVVVAITGRGTPRATFGEIGWTLAMGKPVVWLQRRNGDGGNIFDVHKLVTRVFAVEQALDELKAGLAASAVTP